MAPLTVGVLVMGESLQRWHVDCLDNLEVTARVEAVVVAPEHPAAELPSSAPTRYAARAVTGSTVAPSGSGTCRGVRSSSIPGSAPFETSS